MPLQQRLGDDLGQPPAPGDRQQMLLALGLRQLDQVLGRQPRQFGQHRPRNRDLVIVGQAADHVGGRLLDGSELRAHFGERDPRGDIGQRAQLDGPDQPFEHVAEQLDLFAGIAVGGQQKQVGDLLQLIQMFSVNSALTAASTSSAIDRSNIARPERLKPILAADRRE